MVLEIKTPEVFVPLLEPARYKGAFGGRGAGKSHGFAELLIEEHTANPNQQSVCIREYQRTLEHSVKRLLEDKIQAFGVGSHFEIQDRAIRNRRGKGLIIFEGMQSHNADSIKSLEGFDRAWFAEAHRASQRSLDLLRPTIRRPGSELWFDWNPDSPTDPVDALLRVAKPTDARVIKMTYRDNPWFPDVLRAEMEYDRKTDPDKYAHVWLGEYATSSTRRVFRNWRVEEFETPKGAILYLGADWGFAQDPSVLIRCWIDGRKLYVDWEAYQIGCEIEDTPNLFMTIPEAERWPMGADSSRPDTISHVRRHGFPKIYPSVKGKNSVEDGIEFLRSYEIIVHPRCVHLADELTLYSYQVDKLTGKVLPLLEDRDNHCIDALRYALEARRRGAKAQEAPKVTPLPRQTRWN